MAQDSGAGKSGEAPCLSSRWCQVVGCFFKNQQLVIVVIYEVLIGYLGYTLLLLGNVGYVIGCVCLNLSFLVMSWLTNMIRITLALLDQLIVLVNRAIVVNMTNNNGFMVFRLTNHVPTMADLQIFTNNIINSNNNGYQVKTHNNKNENWSTMSAMLVNITGISTIYDRCILRWAYQFMTDRPWTLCGGSSWSRQPARIAI